MMRVYALVCVLVLGENMHAQPAKDAKKEPKPGDVMIEKYLAAETDKLSGKFLDGAKTLAEWKEKRPRLYREYMDMLGLWPIPEKTPLRATITGFVELDDIIIDKLHFQSKPGLYVTANLYRPIDSEERARNGKRNPAVVYVCGHSNRGRDGNKTAFQDHGMWFARNGYICIMLDTLQLGEIPGVHHGTYGLPWISLKAYEKDGTKRPRPNDHVRWWWHSAGYTPAGVECWNGVRAIDYLVSRPDVDADKIAVTGISGGGAATFWITCADDRVKCAVPVSGMSDLESYVKNKVINGHCDCMFLYNIYQWDWTTIAALVAPRPLLFANSDKDPIFPMDGNRRIIEKLRKLYKMYDGALSGKPLVDEYVSVGGHDYRPDLRIAIFKWINKHIKNDTGPVKDAAHAELPSKMLRVFRHDDEIPKDVINARVDETFVAKGKLELPEKSNFEEWKKQQLRQLKSRVFGEISGIAAVKLLRGIGGHAPLIEYQSESHIPIFVGFGFGGKGRQPTMIVRDELPDDDEKDFLARQVQLWEKHLAGQRGIFLWPRGTFTEGYRWTEKSPPNFVMRSHVLVGQQIGVKRVWDVLGLHRAGQAGLSNAYEIRVQRLGGHGQAGILAAYAALFEPSIKEVVIIDPPKSHMEGPHFLGILRVLDIPEALGLLAPHVKLTLINARDPAFDRTAEIYRLAGAEKMLIRK